LVSWFSAYILIIATMMTTGEVWDSSPTKGGSGMKRMFAPARDCDAALLKGKPAFTGQPIPETAPFDHDFSKSYMKKLTLLAKTGANIPGIVTPTTHKDPVLLSPTKRATTKKRNVKRARKAPPGGVKTNRPDFSLDVNLPTRKGGAPIGNPRVFRGGNLTSSLKGIAGAYNPLPFNIVAPPKRRASHKSPKKAPAANVSKEKITAAAAAVETENKTTGKADENAEDRGGEAELDSPAKDGNE